VSSACSKRRVTDVYLSTHEVAMVVAEQSLWHQDVADCEEGLAALVQQLIDLGAPRKINFWLSASLCRPVKIASVTGILSYQERRLLAESTAIAGSGLTAPCRVWLNNAVATETGPAVVVEEAVLTSIKKASSSVGARAVSIRPWWARALDAALAANPVLSSLGIWEAKTLTVLTGSGDAFSSAQTFTQVGSVELASAAFSRALISAMVAPDDALVLQLDLRASTSRGMRDPLPFGDLPFLQWAVRLGEFS
jgi:hypothetical protein